MVAGSSASWTQQDYTGEPATAQIPSYQIDAANLATWLTGWDAFKTAAEAITIGNPVKEQVNLYNTVLGAGAASDPYAQRELKLLMRFTPDSGSLRGFTRTLACPDLDALTLAAGAGGQTDFVDMDDTGVGAAFKAAVEAIVRHPDDDTITCTLQSMQVVGRNS